MGLLDSISRCHSPGCRFTWRCTLKTREPKRDCVYVTRQILQVLATILDLVRRFTDDRHH